MNKYIATYEAFGEPKKEPWFLYSRHNLHLKYETKDPIAIVNGRMIKLEQYGYSPLDGELSQEEKQVALFLDYLDALLQTYRLRVQYPNFGISYIGSLDTDWAPKIDPSNKDLKPMIQMLTNFCRSMELCMDLIKALNKLDLPQFLIDWKQELNEALEHDHGFYICVSRNLIKQAKKTGKN